MILEIVHNKESGVVTLLIRSNNVSTLAEYRHTIVALDKIVDSSHTILCLRIYLLAMKFARDEFSIFSDHQLYTMTYTLTSPMGYLTEQCQHLFAC